MKGVISLEFIGAANFDTLRQFERFEQSFIKVDIDKNYHPFSRPGPVVLRLYKSENGDIAAQEVFGKRDYSKANSKGTRGVNLCYVLEENEIYWIKERLSWKRTAYYYAAVTPDGDVVELSELQAKEWLSDL